MKYYNAYVEMVAFHVINQILLIELVNLIKILFRTFGTLLEAIIGMFQRGLGAVANNVQIT